MKIMFLICFSVLSCSGLAQSVTGDFNGDGKKETVKKVTIHESRREGGYLPLYVPGVYKISFSDPSIPSFYEGETPFNPNVIPDFNHNKKDQVLLTGTFLNDGIAFPGGQVGILLEYNGKNMVEIATGTVPSTMTAEFQTEKMVFTLNDSTWFISDASKFDSMVCSKLQCKLLYPVFETSHQIITPKHRLYSHFKKYMNFYPDTTTYDIDSIPEFRENKKLTLKEYINIHAIYPGQAKEENRQGTVHVSFVINPLGKVTKVKILKKVDPVLEAEAIRLYKSLPPFEPVIHNGKPVQVRIRDRIVFKLN